jgi:hypothetical protein
VHDFNPGIYDTGLFWIIQVPDDALTMVGNTVKLHPENAASSTFLLSGTRQRGLHRTPGHHLERQQFDAAGASGFVGSHEPLQLGRRAPLRQCGGNVSGTHGNGDFSFQGAGNSAGLFAEMGTRGTGSSSTA